MNRSSGVHFQTEPMRLICPKGCQRRSWRLPGGALAFEAASRGATSATANPVPTPSAITVAYREMLARVPALGAGPTLEFYDDLRGVGGLFIPDQWVIAIGVKDMEDIADRVLSASPAEVARILAEVARVKGVPLPDIGNTTIGAAMGRCIAHELGHALIYRGWHNPFHPDGEAGADYYAGRLDAARGNDWRLGEKFFRSIGCVGPSCDHPTPEGRSNAYVTGYSEQSQRAA